MPKIETQLMWNSSQFISMSLLSAGLFKVTQVFTSPCGVTHWVLGTQR
jgi:hypothetical protein